MAGSRWTAEEEADTGQTREWNGQGGNMQTEEDGEVFGGFVSRSTAYIVWATEGKGEDGS